MLYWPDKDPDEVLDYEIKWGNRLGDNDTIISSEWLIPDGIEKSTDSMTADATIIWLYGGVLGQSYILTNRVETAAGRLMDQSVRIRIRSK